ncbi:hypothetical protein ACNQKP_10475 [Bdellovibrio bacteriovorus]|uniref:hypothetical protein n=1 Tax=Bdellovibrio bacteriovorus TaxID=959 RepID=UPI003AA8F6F3
MEVLVFILTTLFVVLTSISAYAQGVTMRGLRVDPAYFSRLYPNQSIEAIARRVVTQAKRAGANTLFLYAYSPLHGSFYRTTYPFTEVEEQMGEDNVFLEVYNTARTQGLKVVAVIPVNDFKKLWEEHPDWRSKMRNGLDYKPFSRTHHLSAWHPAYRAWFRGYVHDLLQKFPDLYAIEAVEPTVDCFWTGEPDYNPVSNAEFQRRHPLAALGDATWLKFRAQGLTNLVAIMSTVAHEHNILSAVVHTWPAHATGRLMSSEQIRDQVGFDFDGTLNLEGPEKIDIIVGEFLWQQWAGEYGGSVFTPEWTRRASLDFVRFVSGRSLPILHVEISPWYGQDSMVQPTLQEFQRTLWAIRDLGYGIDVYDHSQIEDRRAWSVLSDWTH